MKLWELDKSKADVYTAAIKRIIAPFLLVDGSIEQDQSECGDLVLVVTKDRLDLRIGCRVREATAVRWISQVTLRYARISGAKTECEKVLCDGLGTLFFYGIAHPEKRGEFAAWRLLDLDRLRDCLFKIEMPRLHAGWVPSLLLREVKKTQCYQQGILGVKGNHDRETSFVWIDFDKLSRHQFWDPRIIIAQCLPPQSGRLAFDAAE